MQMACVIVGMKDEGDNGICDDERQQGEVGLLDKELDL